MEREASIADRSAVRPNPVGMLRAISQFWSVRNETPSARAAAFWVSPLPSRHCLK